MLCVSLQSARCCGRLMLLFAPALDETVVAVVVVVVVVAVVAEKRASL